MPNKNGRRETLVQGEAQKGQTAENSGEPPRPTRVPRQCYIRRHRAGARKETPQPQRSSPAALPGRIPAALGDKATGRATSEFSTAARALLPPHSLATRPVSVGPRWPAAAGEQRYRRQQSPRAARGKYLSPGRKPDRQ